ncbi:MAG: decaprenyl-phosphate phosphoribosyltransferase [candidate division WOR-3 bacterium]
MTRTRTDAVAEAGREALTEAGAEVGVELATKAVTAAGGAQGSTGGEALVDFCAQSGRSMPVMLGALVVSMRPKQWVKNLLVFAGLIFSKNLMHGPSVLRSFAGFVSFCLLSGAVYIINDLVDKEQDRRHPTKKDRPIASGRVPGPVALTGAGLAVGVAFVVGFALDWRFGFVGLVYFVMQLAYSLKLKQVVVLDVLIVALGFALRAISGTYVVHVRISPWLFICTILLALFVALAKRRHELVFLEGGGISHRSVLGKYNETLLDQMIAVATSATVVAYCLYTIAPETVEKFGTNKLYLTFPFVLYGICRYLYLVYRKDLGGTPEKVLFSDVPLLVDIFLWMATVVVILYVRF